MSDRKIFGKNGSLSYIPKVLSYNHYYPFGMPMPNRNSTGNYRYAYQGQEKDPETGKEAFELRLWDSRIGRWTSVDPYGQFNSPYLGMANNPITAYDINGGVIPPQLITGAIGAIINIGINAYDQHNSGELGWNTKSLTRLGVAGVGGFAAGATGNLALASGINVVADLTDQAIAGKQLNVTKSIITGGLTFIGGKASSRLFNNKTINRKLTDVYAKFTKRSLYRGSVNNIRTLESFVGGKADDIIGGLSVGAFTNKQAEIFSNKINHFMMNLYFQQMDFSSSVKATIEVGDVQQIGYEIVE